GGRRGAVSSCVPAPRPPAARSREVTMFFGPARDRSLVGTLLVLAFAASAARAADWPQYRGPGRTNVSSDTGLLQQWAAEGPPLAWKTSGLGEGVPSVAVAAGRVFTLGYDGADEFLRAWDAASGRQLWGARVGPAVNEQRQMRWLSQRTPTIDGDRAYAVTARGELVCVATADGAERWRKDYA